MFEGKILITGGTGTLGQAIVQYAINFRRDSTFTNFFRLERPLQRFDQQI